MTRDPSAARRARFLARLFRQNEFALKLGLEPMRAALAACGAPQRAYATTLVAGTNGKGSVASLLATLCQLAGAHAGLYTSPHLIAFRERIRVDGAALDEAALMAVGPAVLAHFGGPGAWEPDDAPLPELRGAPDGGPLTYFELATLMAALAFARAGCAQAVFEVGLGGRLDATNALDPCLSVITAIGLDHQAVLGDTLEAIAAEKAGIMRPGVPVIIGSRPAQGVLRDLARRVGAPTRCLDADFTLSPDAAGWRFEGLGRSWRLPPLPALDDAPHARDNTATALAAALTLADAGHLPALDAARASQALTRARWPGRLWLAPPDRVAAAARRAGLPRAPQLLLDAAHNPAGAAALASVVKRRYDGRAVALLFAALADKDAAGTLAPLRTLPGLVEVVLAPLDGPRALTPDALRRRLGLPERAAAPSLDEALERALRAAGPDGLVLVAGSIYLLGAVMQTLGCEDLALNTVSPSPLDPPEP